MKPSTFVKTVLPVLILIGCIGGVLYTQRQIWGGITLAPTLDDLTGTWRSSLSGHGFTNWLNETPISDKFLYDVELELTQSGKDITGYIIITMRGSQVWGTNLPPELAGQLNNPFTYQITDGHVDGVKIKFKTGNTNEDYIQWTGTFLTDSMTGMTEEHVVKTQYDGIERVGPFWVGEFNLHRAW